MSEVEGGSGSAEDFSPEQQSREQAEAEKIEATAIRYHFDEEKLSARPERKGRGWIFSEMRPKENKIFLAMLDEYVTSTGFKFPEKEKITALDFGAGNMPYIDAYYAFFERYGKTKDENRREMHITGWDSSSQNGIPTPDEINVHLESQEQIDKLTSKGFKIKDLDVLTMFGCGPGEMPVDPRIVEQSYKRAIALLAPNLNKDGLFIMTTSFGGPKHENMVRYIEEAGLEILLDEPNKFQEKLGTNIGFTHEDIIIARKKAKTDESK
jgi:hypothetical protein